MEKDNVIPFPGRKRQELIQAYETITEQNLEEILFHSEKIEKPWELGYLLTRDNFDSIIGVLKKYLQYKDAKAPIQSLILHKLIEGNWRGEVTICKQGKCKTIVPAFIGNELEEFEASAIEHLTELLWHNNPSLLDMLKEYLNYYLFYIFPFYPEPENSKSWAVALYIYGMYLIEESVEEEQILVHYAEHREEIESIRNQLNFLEEENNEP